MPRLRGLHAQQRLGELLASDVRADKVKIVYRSLETATRDPQTFQTQQVAALAAGKQNRFEDYIELFYRQQGAEGTGYVSDSYLAGLANQIPGLNIGNWRSARNNSALISRCSPTGRPRARPWRRARRHRSSRARAGQRRRRIRAELRPARTREQVGRMTVLSGPEDPTSSRSGTRQLNEAPGVRRAWQGERSVERAAQSTA